MPLTEREKFEKAATKDQERFRNEQSGMASGAHLTSDLKLAVKKKTKSSPKLTTVTAPESPKINKNVSPKPLQKKTVSANVNKLQPPKTEKSNLSKPAV